jgi:hypothetical protein
MVVTLSVESVCPENILLQPEHDLHATPPTIPYRFGCHMHKVPHQDYVNGTKWHTLLEYLSYLASK